MLGKVVVVLGLIILVFFGYIYSRPATMLISRELLIKASPEKLFPYINNAQKSNEWMPWAESDPGVKMVYTGPQEGLGAISSWDSTGKMGTGQAEVVESVALKVVKTQLTYTKPMVMKQLAEVSLNPTAEGTVVRWSVTGENGFLGKLFGVLMNMDAMVGGEFEKGLGKLKAIAEASP
ncbi:MAG: SRPBCC family protein [Proteobacteria bacterium]|nr:SRPBCC family protein [Pseudomonadota bacterium]